MLEYLLTIIVLALACGVWVAVQRGLEKTRDADGEDRCSGCGGCGRQAHRNEG